MCPMGLTEEAQGHKTLSGPQITNDTGHHMRDVHKKSQAHVPAAHRRVQIRLQQGMQLAAQGGPHGLPALVHRVRARQAAGHEVRRRAHALLVGLKGKVLRSRRHSERQSSPQSRQAGQCELLPLLLQRTRPHTLLTRSAVVRRELSIHLQSEGKLYAGKLCFWTVAHT